MDTSVIQRLTFHAPGGPTAQVPALWISALPSFVGRSAVLLLGRLTCTKSLGATMADQAWSEATGRAPSLPRRLELNATPRDIFGD